MKNYFILFMLLTGYAFTGSSQLISIGAPSPEYITESGGSQIFTVTLSAPQSFPISFDFQSYNAFAASGSDYISTSGTLTFAPGQTTKTITVSIVNDYLAENQEHYYILITNAMNVNTSAPINTSPYFSYGYIDDDDPTMSVTSVSPEYVQEGAGSQVFSVTLSSAQAYPISFEYQTANGNALSGDDYNSRERHPHVFARTNH